MPSWTSVRPLPAIAACALLGCRPDPASPAGDGSAGPVEVECPEGAVVLDDSSNYSLISQVDIPSTAVAPGADVAVDFSAVGTDLFGQPLDPAADLDTVAILEDRTHDADSLMEKMGRIKTLGISLVA